MALEILPTLWSFLKSLLNYRKEKRSREEKYDLKLLPKRFEVYQEAYRYADKLKFLIHGGEEKDQTVTEAKEWFNKNCLYLKPGLRKDFQDFIQQVSTHSDLREEWQRTGQTEGFETEKTQKLSKKLEDKFAEIWNMQKKIQEDIDQYYKSI